MLKKIAVICALSLLLTSTGLVFAEYEGTTPDSPLYELGCLIEETVMDLTGSNLETALWALKFAEDRINKVNEELERGRPDFVEFLLEENEELINKAEVYLIDMLETEDDEEADNEEEVENTLEDVKEKVNKAHQRRTERLQYIIDNKNIPEEAKTGIANAMENQERALSNFESAMEKAQQALQNSENDKDMKDDNSADPNELLNDNVEQETLNNEEQTPPDNKKQGPPENEVKVSEWVPPVEEAKGKEAPPEDTPDHEVPNRKGPPDNISGKPVR